jgi:hypothetical protein
MDLWNKHCIQEAYLSITTKICLCYPCVVTAHCPWPWQPLISFHIYGLSFEECYINGITPFLHVTFWNWLFFFLFSKMPLPLKGKFVIKKAKSSKLNALIVWHVLGFKLRLLIYSGFPSCHLRSNFYHFISCMFKFSDKASGVGSETSMAWLLLQFASLSS